MNTSSIKRMQQFVNRTTGQKIRVTKVEKSKLTPNSRKNDMCRVLDVGPLGVTDKNSARIIKSDSIRRHYTKV